MKLAVFVTSRFELTWSCRVHARGFVFLFFCFFFPPLFTKMTTMTEPRWLSQVSRRFKNLPPLFGRSIRKYFALSIGTFFFFFPPACMLSPSPIYQSNNEKQDRRYIFSCIVRMYVYIGDNVGWRNEKDDSVHTEAHADRGASSFLSNYAFPELVTSDVCSGMPERSSKINEKSMFASLR